MNSKRVLLTHMGQAMFGRLDEVTLEVAEDGQLIELWRRSSHRINPP